MSDEARQRQTTVNVQEKANLIWAIADKLVGVYKPHEYGNVILPLCVVKRFDDTLAPTKQAVLDENRRQQNVDENLRYILLERVAGQKFYNLSPFTFPTLLGDPAHIKENFTNYLNGFSANVADIIESMDFGRELDRLADNGLLYLVVSEFCTQKAYLGADLVSSVDMGYIFEELVRKFSESYDEHAGAHFTARDIIEVMAEVLIGDEEENMRQGGIVATVYDMAMGTSQMLSCLTDRFMEIDPEADVKSFGQEINKQTYAIAKADTLIKGGNVDNMRLGDTLGDDKFDTYKFDYVISNPPFGIEWKQAKENVEKEHRMGEAGRFAPGLPTISDGQMLFMLNGAAKLKDEGGRMAIIQNGSPLFKGDAGSGESNIRGYLLEHDWLEAIIQLPGDLFYNTGIATYIWVITKSKSPQRRGRVQLIDASECYEKRRKSLGNKRVELTAACRSLIMEAYRGFSNWEYRDEERALRVESKVFTNDYFKFSKLTIVRPLRLRYENLAMPPEGSVAKEKERRVLQQTVDAYNAHLKGQAVSDDELFRMLREHGIRTTKANATVIRRWLGTKDAEQGVVHSDPANTYSAPEWDSDLTDTEIVPWQENVEEYVRRNVLPYAPDAQVDESKTEIGYEIPFTREFYRYVAPRRSGDIFARLRELGEQEAELMNKILG